jgi:hypothetical protein
MTEPILPDVDSVLQEFQEQLRENGLLEPENNHDIKVLLKATERDLPKQPLSDAQSMGDTTSQSRLEHARGVAADQAAAARFAQTLGLPVTVLSPAQEAEFLYKSVLRTQEKAGKNSPMGRAPSLVVDISETTTFLACGKDILPLQGNSHSRNEPLESETPRLPSWLELGWGTLLLENPANPLEVQLAQAEVTRQLEETPGAMFQHAAQAHAVFIGMNEAYQWLTCLETPKPQHNTLQDLKDVVDQVNADLESMANASDAELLNPDTPYTSPPSSDNPNPTPLTVASPDASGQNVTPSAPEGLLDNVIENGLNTARLDYYLSMDGLAKLAEIVPDQAASDDPEALSPLAELVGSLIILRALSEFLGIDCFQFGASGGLNAGLLDDAVRQQVVERNSLFSQILHTRYEESYAQAQHALEQLFPELKHCLEGRVKEPMSITHKLNVSAFKPDAAPLHTLEEAFQRITDGHGFVFVLRDVLRPAIVQIRDGLFRAIRCGHLELIAIKNYRGADPDTVPYFRDDDIVQIRLAMEQYRMQSPAAHRLPRPVVLEGDDTLKPSGYTATQLRIRLRNPETNEFDLPDVDLHICGEKVYRFFRGADHLVYDIRQGKDIYQGNSDIKACFEPEVRPLLEAIETMSETLFNQFSDYRGQTYAYLRQLEMGQTPSQPPRPPDDLPDICHLAHLTRLGNLQRRLIEKASQLAQASTGNVTAGKGSR